MASRVEGRLRNEDEQSRATRADIPSFSVAREDNNSNTVPHLSNTSHPAVAASGNRPVADRSRVQSSHGDQGKDQVGDRSAGVLQDYIGNSRAHCGDRCICPEDIAGGCCPVSFTWITTIIFLTSVLSPSDSGAWWEYLLTIILLTASQLMHLFAVTCDPGIIPHRKRLPPPQPEKVRLFDGSVIDAKICKTCNVIRPPRSSHCTVCNYCVEDYDHHCGVLGSCVAKRTFRFFALYMYATTALSGWVLVRSGILLSRAGVPNDVEEEFKQGFGVWRVIAAVLCIIVTLCATLMAGGQGLGYLYIACTGSSTKIDAQRKRAKAAAAGRVTKTEDEAKDGCVVYDDDSNTGLNPCHKCCLRFFGPFGKSRLPPPPSVTAAEIL